MKKIKLPITQSYSTTLDLQNIPADKIVSREGRTEIRFPQIDFSDSEEELQMARENGVMIVYATISNESRIDQLLLYYFFKPAIEINRKRDFFMQNILQSSGMTYSFKRELLEKIVNENNLLEGEDKNILSKYLKAIMTWRNAFAHGNIHYDSTLGVQLRYFQGTAKVRDLDDAFWTEIEECYNGTDKLFDLISVELFK